MADESFNDFREDTVAKIRPALLGRGGGEKEYVEPQTRPGSPLRILFLSSDSIRAATGFIAKGSVGFAKGLLIQHQKNVKDLANIPEEAHLITAFQESYKAGGRRTLSAMLALAEEEHAIQAAVDKNKDVCFDKHFNVRIDEVAQRIKDKHPTVFHFSGHAIKGRGLVFCCRDEFSEIGFKNEYMNQDQFLACFKGESVLLAIIVSCRSADIARALVESGAAKIAIGADSEIKDDCALNFVEHFYDELARISNLTNEDFENSVKKAYAFAIKPENVQQCPMRLFPEISSVRPVGKRMINNEIGNPLKSLKGPLTPIKTRMPNNY